MAATDELAGSKPPSPDRYPVPLICGKVGRRFLPALGATLVLWGMAWPFLTLGFVNHHGSPDAEWIESMYQRKDWAMRQSAGPNVPRLVVLGGSGALFGVDADLIQRKLGVTTINYATHAGLNTYLLYRARQVARPGDSVLLCPEYELWWADDISDLEWDFFATYDKRFFWSSGKREALQSLYSVPGSSYGDSLMGWGRRLIGKYQDERASYDVATMDANGDLRGPIWREPFSIPDGYPMPSAAKVDGPNEDFRQFARWARQNRVRVFYSWPNCCRPDPPPTDAQRLASPEVKRLFDSWGFILLNNPKDTWFPSGWFMDTCYHPDPGCRRVRTEALIRAMRPYYGLPADPPTPAGIYLVGGHTWWLNAGNAFAGRPGIQARYLTLTPLDSPDSITPTEVAQWCARGVPVWFDDPNIEPMFQQNSWKRREVDRREQSLGDWLKQYDRHLFLLARSRGTNAVGASLATIALPGEVRSALEGASPAVAIVGTGPWSGVHRLATNSRAASLRISLERLVGQNVPHLALSLHSETAAAEGSRISANGRRFAASTDGRICVVVIEPNEGVVVDAATFADGGPRTLWTMKQIFPRQRSPARAAP
jgi:hypothetical protein